MSCTCDDIQHPRPLDIQPGLSRLQRQIASFPEFRRAMIESVHSDTYAAALGSWSASGDVDLGLMLLEMWAYVADVIAFYDEVHAHECYIRTARREDSLRDLVDRLGYIPAPAVAASVELALLADGRKLVSIPVGTAFRSGAFDGEAPQVFEISEALSIHPLRSRWLVEPPRPSKVDDTGGPGASTITLALDPARSAKWAEGDYLLVQPDPDDEGTWQTAIVTGAEPDTTDQGEKVLELSLSLDGDADLELGAGRSLAGVRILRPTRQATLSQLVSTAVDESSSDTDFSHATTLSLDGTYRDLRPGAVVLLARTGESRAGVRWFKVTGVNETTVTTTVATSTYGSSTTSTAYKGYLPITEVTIDVDIDSPDRGCASNWGNSDKASLLLLYGLREGGRLAAPKQGALGATDTIGLQAPLPRPVDDTGDGRVALVDADGVSLVGGATVDFSARTLTPSSWDDARAEMTLPVSVYANLVTATRGETVKSETLGSGDATQTNQSFTLKKSPLTYVQSATSSSGWASTLTVYVDGVAWTEVSTFYGQDAEDKVYIVRLDSDGVATITFGDGVRGARLSTGTSNVVASYRFGAGAAAPPAGSIVQIARGTTGLRSVRQPADAGGGSDAEDPENIREQAPVQALTMGRAVSIRDMEAFASACTGVRAVAVSWAWDRRSQRPVVKVWVAGDTDVSSTVRARLLAVSDPSTPIAVCAATARPITLALDIDTDDDYVGDDVIAQVVSALLDAPDGVLCVEQLGIGRPIYFSQLMATIHAVAGVVSVAMTWTRANGTLVAGYGDTPGQGAYFDLSGGITINGEDYVSG